MLIAIEGCVGVGKSTVAQGLAAHRESQALLEDFASNPFLKAFSEDPVRNAVETEFGFLLLHFHQLKSVRCSATEVVADFHLGKDLIYADLNLPAENWKKRFTDLYRLCQAEVGLPDLLIYLAANTDLALERIAKRGRELELKIPSSYFGRVNMAYENYFEAYTNKKLRLPMSEWDFVGSPALFPRLSAMADKALKCL